MKKILFGLSALFSINSYCSQTIITIPIPAFEQSTAQSQRNREIMAQLTQFKAQLREIELSVLSGKNMVRTATEVFTLLEQVESYKPTIPHTAQKQIVEAANLKEKLKHCVVIINQKCHNIFQMNEDDRELMIKIILEELSDSQDPIEDVSKILSIIACLERNNDYLADVQQFFNMLHVLTEKCLEKLEYRISIGDNLTGYINEILSIIAWLERNNEQITHAQQLFNMLNTLIKKCIDKLEEGITYTANQIKDEQENAHELQRICYQLAELETVYNTCKKEGNYAILLRCGNENRYDRRLRSLGHHILQLKNLLR